MHRDARAYLWDIQKAAEAIGKFVAGLDARTYAETDVVHSAVERKFEVIGEALSQLSKLDPALARRIPDAGDIIAFRNILIHGYAGVEHDRVWRIAATSLPALLVTVAALLSVARKDVRFSSTFVVRCCCWPCGDVGNEFSLSTYPQGTAAQRI